MSRFPLIRLHLSGIFMKIISVRQRLYPALLLPLTFSPVLQAASASNEQTMIVTATPQTVSELDTPAAVSVIEGEDMRLATPRVNLSETLTSVPGLQVQNRQNYAQDLQISIRGFGSRSAFGVRGIRLYVDGIPATMPDGQGQISNIDINSIQDVEVLRGPFSALYGNASGGVINVTTETGRQPPTLEASSYYGSYGSWRYGLKATGAMGDGTQPGDVDYTVSTTRFTTHGYRDHSGAQKNLANAKLGVRLDDVSKLSLIFNSVDIKADDPGGLTESEWKADPQQAPRAEQYNTRKTIKQTQAGLRYERQLSAQDDISVMAYAGERETTQYQSIPLVAQLKPAQAGGVITLQRHYQGIDSRWTHRGELGVPVTFTGGLNYENMSENRKGYNNFRLNNGTPEFGHKGDLRRDERNLMWNVDPYLQTQWQLTQKLSLDAGVRYSSVWFDSNDHYIAPGNGDDSGDASYHHWLPAGSLKYALTDAWNLYPRRDRRLDDRPRYSHGHKHTNVNLVVSCAGFNRLVNAWRRPVGDRASGIIVARCRGHIHCRQCPDCAVRRHGIVCAFDADNPPFSCRCNAGGNTATLRPAGVRDAQRRVCHVRRYAIGVATL